MKSIRTYPKVGEAFEAIDKLSASGVFAHLSGCRSRGYDVLIRDDDSERADAVLALSPARPQETAVDVGALGPPTSGHIAQELTPEVTK